MAERKRILAMAVGPERSATLRKKSVAGNVRPYIAGLISGLASHGKRIGQDYEIDYRERPKLDGKKSDAIEAFKPSLTAPHDLIFGMSTTVVRAARLATKNIPIVGVVSDNKAEGFGAARNITGISARRSQSADQCLESFLATVPSLTRIFVLHKRGYGPSERALKLVKTVAKKHDVGVRVVAVRTRADVARKLPKLPKQKSKTPPTDGLFVLPIDMCLGWTGRIVELSQGRKGIPAFFPITDCVSGKASSALGGRGVPQTHCGALMADYVHRILWRGAKPASLKIAQAGDDAFEWVVSSKAAKALNVKIPHVV